MTYPILVNAGFRMIPTKNNIHTMI